MQTAFIFWTSIGLSVLCIFKTDRSHKINRWDFLFLLSSWQVFNLKIWQSYLAGWVPVGSYDAAAILLVVLAACYAARRGLGLSLDISSAAALCFFKYFALLTLLIPIGLALGFLHFHPKLDPAYVLNTIGQYCLVVSPNEELIFRGIVLNLLLKRFKSGTALLITTSLFATIYTHLTGNGVFPNWTYVGFAFAAGLGYGQSYLKSRNLAVPILLHGCVDAIWRIFLS
jgi:membrane protease YdiL (CAAX protease family)